jgi:hypothetical protein
LWESGVRAVLEGGFGAAMLLIGGWGHYGEGTPCLGMIDLYSKEAFAFHRLDDAANTYGYYFFWLGLISIMYGP